jgi:hypothetical protein
MGRRLAVTIALYDAGEWRDAIPPYAARLPLADKPTHHRRVNFAKATKAGTASATHKKSLRARHAVPLHRRVPAGTRTAVCEGETMKQAGRI